MLLEPTNYKLKPIAMDVENSNKGDKGASNYRLLSIAIVVIVVILLGLVFGSRFDRSVETIPGEYQAVFLTNGQVYFGQIMKETSRYTILTDIYYLQMQQGLQSQQLTADGEEVATEQEPQLTLIKLGNELHGPSDQMTISREHILFIEGLSDTSQVLQSIKQNGLVR